MRAAVVAAAFSFLLGCGGGGGQGAVDAGTPPVWLGVIGTGQSLSVGAASGNLLFTTPSDNDLKLSLGARATSWPIDATDPELSLAPLVEPIRPLDTGSSRPYPNNIYGETFHTAMGAQLGAINQAIAGADLTSVHSVVGQGDSSITVIQKNGTGNAYAASLFEATAFARLVAAAGARYEVGAVVLTHGERDAERATYEDDIARLASDYDQDLKPITGQTARDSAHRQSTASRSGGRPLDVDDRGLEGGRGLPGQDLLRGSEVPVRLRGRSHPPGRRAIRPPGRQIRGGVPRGGRAWQRLAAVAADRRHPRRADAERALSRSVSAAGVGRGVRRAPPGHARRLEERAWASRSRTGRAR